jgi:hypothetical protein
MVKISDLVKNNMTDAQKAVGEIGSLPHPKDAIALTEAMAEKMGAPDVIKAKVIGK